MASPAFPVLLPILYGVATIGHATVRERPPGHERPDAPRRRTGSILYARMSAREMNADHLWSLTVPVASPTRN